MLHAAIRGEVTPEASDETIKKLYESIKRREKTVLGYHQCPGKETENTSSYRLQGK